MSVYVCLRVHAGVCTRERKRESVCACVCKRVRVFVCACACAYVVYKSRFRDAYAEIEMRQPPKNFVDKGICSNMTL